MSRVLKVKEEVSLDGCEEQGEQTVKVPYSRPVLIVLTDQGGAPNETGFTPFDSSVLPHG